MRLDDDRGMPMALVNTILATMASVHAMTGSVVAGLCAAGAVLAALSGGGRRPGG